MAELMEMKRMKDEATEILIQIDKIGEGDVMKKFVETRTLKVSLTTDEVMQAGDDLVEAMNEVKALESELDSIKKHFKHKQTELEAKIDQHRTKVHDKWEFRKVDCVEIRDNTTGSVIQLRMDSGEIINERAMTADERQGHLWDETEEDDAPEGVDKETGEVETDDAPELEEVEEETAENED